MYRTNEISFVSHLKKGKKMMTQGRSTRFGLLFRVKIGVNMVVKPTIR